MFGGFDHRKTTAYCLTYGIWGFAPICFVIGAKATVAEYTQNFGLHPSVLA